MILWIKRITGIIVGTVGASGIVALVIDRLEKPTDGHKPYGVYEQYIKRPFDLIFSCLAIIILSPILLITAILVRIKLGSPILFAQERPGRDEKVFRIYKFRTMTDERDDNGELLPDLDRLTRFGAILRTSSIDELPELVNIIKGDMSLVGPRPLLVRYLPYYTEAEKHRHDVRPGLTGLAQVNGRNLAKWDQRLAYDIEYVNHITFIGDLKILFKTLIEVINHDGIAADTDMVETYFDKERNSASSQNIQ